MTIIESLMLYATFGGFVGIAASLWIFIIKEWIRERKEKKKNREQQ